MRKKSIIKEISGLLILNVLVASIGFMVSYHVGLIGLSLALILTGYRLWTGFVAPLNELNEQVKLINTDEISNYGVKKIVTPTREISELTHTLSRLAKRFNKRIRTIEMQSNEREAILSSLSEGVVVVHKDESVLLMNQEAQKILSVPNAYLEDFPTMEVLIKIPELVEFIKRSLSSQLPEEAEFKVFNGKKCILQAKSRPLKEITRRMGGGVAIVLSDVTKVRELEAHRREFITNVSHELRTPLTSIQGFSETLLSSHVDEEQRKKFLEIIQRHAGRLNTIIEDILSLARLERSEGAESIPLKTSSVYEVLKSAIELCDVKAKKYKVSLLLTCPEDLKGDLNAQLLEQAVINLIDNAIKYSSEGLKIDISCEESGKNIIIRVKDYGQGIPEKDLPRLFERFYRVDKARSRQNGGTGLGLAISKHIVLVHKGTLRVESQVGQGSEFTICFPKQSLDRPQPDFECDF